MTKRQRTILFLFLGIVFLGAAPSIILYSQGYRFDWSNRRLTQVGALSLGIIPNQAEIVVNGKRAGQTGRLVNVAFTKNLAPGSHQVSILKEGYHAWEKNLQVQPKQITEAKHITLFPIQPAFTVLFENAQRFWFALNGQDALIQKQAGNSWQLLLWNPADNTAYPLFEPSLPQETIARIAWAPDSNSFLLQTETQGQEQTFVQTLNRDLLGRQKTEQESLRAAAQSRKPQPPNILSQPALAVLQIPRQTLWLDEQGILWQQNNGDIRPIQLNQTPFAPAQDGSYEIRMSDDEFFLQENQTLYILNRKTQSFQEFFKPFREMALSPNGNAVAISSGKELWLHFFEETREQPPRQKGERVFLTRFGEDITNLTWINSHYLAFVVGDTIKITEIDKRDRLNMIDLATFSGPSLFWQNATKSLFVHTDGTVRASEKLLP